MAGVCSFSVPERLLDERFGHAREGVREQVDGLKIELERIQSFLSDTDGKRIKGERDRQFIKELREIAYDAEDVIEEFNIVAASDALWRRRRHHGLAYLDFCVFFPIRRMIYTEKVRKKIEAIRAKITDRSEARERYGIKSFGEEEPESSSSVEVIETRMYSILDDESIIGSEQDMKLLLAALIEGGDQRRVISIVGMGGIGKTTLAQKLYNHNVVRSHFDCFAWVCVTQEFRTRDLLQAILQQVNATGTEEKSMMRRMHVEPLMEMLYRFLREKRYLVVLDDVWSFKAWENLSPAFPNGRRGSRMMITTRLMEIAIQADPISRPHQVGLLTAEKSWELFCRTAFPYSEKNHLPDPRWEPLGREIVARCAGVPLAIRALGGLLRNKKSIQEWEKVIRTFSYDPGTNRILEVLALSYNDLPYRLKPCFLYLGLFLSETEISTKRLIRLWIAEGFITQEDKNRNLEDVGEAYLGELIARNMVLVGKVSSMGRVLTCRLHDLMLDLCMAKATETGFFYNVTQVTSSSSDLPVVLPDTARRCVVLNTQNNILEQSIRRLRTLMMFNVEDRHLVGLRDFKLLRILDLEGVNTVEFIPAGIGSLIHLRYLGLKYAYIKELPKSIGNLWSLQTFDLRYCAWDIKMPDVIWKMEQLRHLEIGGHFHSGHLRMDTLKNLSTLKHMRAGPWIEQLVHLTNLRELGIKELPSSQLEIVVHALAVKLKSLQSLWLSMNSEPSDEFAHLEPLSHDCPSLRKLHLEGPISEDRLIQWPKTLRKLTLIGSRLKNGNFMQTLQDLPHLVVLRLLEASFNGKVLICTGLLQLEVLYLWGLENLERWEIKEGALPHLKQLHVQRCPNFCFTSEELSFIPTLQELKIKDMPGEFEDKIRGEGKNFHGLQRMPSVITA